MDFLKGALILVQVTSVIALIGCVLVVLGAIFIKVADFFDEVAERRAARRAATELRIQKEIEAHAEWRRELYCGFDNTGDIIPQIYRFLAEEDNFDAVEKLRDDLQ